MKALVVYDSVFGNTEQIAQSMAEALGAGIRKIDAIAEADLTGVNLVVVGSPTRGFRPTAAISNWLKKLPRGILVGVRVAAFDTRISPEELEKSPGFLKWMVNHSGFAADPIGRELESAGGRQSVPPEGFYVHGQKGPLLEGELVRAAAWAKKSAEGIE